MTTTTTTYVRYILRTLYTGTSLNSQFVYGIVALLSSSWSAGS